MRLMGLTSYEQLESIKPGLSYHVKDALLTKSSEGIYTINSDDEKSLQDVMQFLKAGHSDIK